ncbi:hypothetical protein [Spiroplasma eriocheiris]|uniref:Transmembrane protein n=1 Tax=Spiroplasma eriocheiris TaxID=315358 RepID=A0A0H3XM47_9MOLU|nr:hypothetical protein [Spiroplasma eriocheiris]AHF58234.1 putative transmembrane protein [Spiroplasma eriocheiris CCTCC M 207170]AKM54669.1 hypothetical protein SERIO_v1c11160 [Spiroplasma eriocheiris]
MTKLILIAIVFFLYYYWVFSSTGTILADLLKIRTRNIYLSMIMGFFFYFATIAFLLIPLEFIGNLKYIVLVYYLLAINILYAVILLLFVRFWFNYRLLDWNHLLFVLVFTMFIFLYYLKNLFITPSGQNLSNSFVLTFYNFNFDNGRVIFNLNSEVTLSANSTLSAVPWFTNVSMWFAMTKLNPIDITTNLLDIFDALLFASIFITLLNNFSKKNSNKIIIGSLSLVTLLASKLLIYYFGYDAWHPENMLTNLFFVLFILISIYTNREYRSRNMPWIIGFIFASYITFDWDASYIILFTIYVTTWISILRFRTNFLKDFVKFSAVSSICFIVYNARLKNLLLIFIFLALLLLMLFIAFLLYRNYTRIREIEFAIYERRRGFIFVIPTIFTIISVVIVLATNQINLDFWTLEKIAQPLFVQLELGRWREITDTVFISISFFFLGFALIWILFMERIPNFVAKTQITMLSILTVSFFNPLVGRFLIWIFNSQALLNNATVFIVALLVAINTTVYAIKTKPFNFKLSRFFPPPKKLTFKHKAKTTRK